MFKFTRRLKPVTAHECECRNVQGMILDSLHRIEGSSRRQEVILEHLLELTQDQDKAQAEHDLAKVLADVVTSKIAEGIASPNRWGH